MNICHLHKDALAPILMQQQPRADMFGFQTLYSFSSHRTIQEASKMCKTNVGGFEGIIFLP